MSNDEYFNDDKLSSIEGWLCAISGNLEEMKDLMKEGIIELKCPMPKKGDVYCKPKKYQESLSICYGVNLKKEKK